MEAIFDIEQGFHEIEELPSSPPPLPLPLPPPKKTSRLSVILLDQGLFTVYKRLFVVCFSLNMTILLLAATNIYPHPTKHAPLISIANIFAVVICRSEAVLRLLYWLAVNLLGWWWVPLRLKTMATSLLQSLGGVHSGCGVSSIAWLAYAIGLAVKDGETPPEIIAVASAILALTCVTSLAAFPLVRLLHHNLFERTHRFAGWTALFLLWAFVSLQVSYNPQTRSYGRDKPAWRFFNSLEFWLTTGITILIVTPWLTLRRVPVRVSSPSGHAAIIKFDGGVEAGILGRISPSPFSEWHAFGIISDNKEEHMMVAAVAGDFTRSLVTNPPAHLWVRKVHFAGVPYSTSMYNRVLLVATGSGGVPLLPSAALQGPSASDLGDQRGGEEFRQRNYGLG